MKVVDRELTALRELALRMGACAEAILGKAWRAIRERNRELCNEVMGDDLEIDRLDLEIDDAVLRVLALQAPVAHDLREVIAIKTMATDLERVGDLARDIAERVDDMDKIPTERMPAGLDRMANDSRRLLHKALDAFVEADASLAHQVLAEDDAIDALEKAVIDLSLSAIESDPENARQLVAFVSIAKSLERVADHATNIAEEVLLVTRAENLKHAGKLRN